MAVRSHLRHYPLAGLAAGAVALAGCAAVPGPGSGTSPGGAHASAPAHAKVLLKFILTNGPGTAPRHWTLSCGPPGGSSLDPAAACRALTRMPVTPMGPFGSHKNVMCPMIVKSDRQIVVTGTWFGTRVRRVIIDGGCDIALFESMFKLLR